MSKDLFGKEPMKALSWKEPFASLMLHGKIETRTWDTKYRGLVLICASLKPYTEMDLIGISGERLTQEIFTTLNSKEQKINPGYAIAVGRLRSTKIMCHGDEALSFVKCRENLICHYYEDVRPIVPMKWKGCQGWKNVPQEFIDKINLLKNNQPLMIEGFDINTSKGAMEYLRSQGLNPEQIAKDGMERINKIKKALSNLKP